jgi:hypothetical protein
MFAGGVAAAMVLATAAPADAGLLFSNPGTASGCGAGCWASGGNDTTYFRTWDNFVVANDATVTSVTWRGVAYDAGAEFPNLDTLSWDLGFFSDDGGTPGTEEYNVHLADADVTRTQIGTGFVGGRNVLYWEFSASLPVGFDATGGATYWFSPFSNQTDYYPVFAWSGSLGGNTYQEDSNGGAFVRTNNRAFTLSGSVPEPQTWALMIMGFGAAGAALRGRRRVAA